MRKCILAAALGFTVLAMSAQAAVLISASVTGQQQGAFKGEGTVAGHKDVIKVLDYSFEAETPRDSASGQASGKRQYKPLTIVKEVDASSPQFLNAMNRNENLTQVTIEFYKPAEGARAAGAGGATGAETVYYTIRLTNAHVASIKQHLDDAAPSGTAARAPATGAIVEDIAFTFEKIDVESATGKTSATDSWLSR